MLRFIKGLLQKKFTPLNLITIHKQRLLDNYKGLSAINPKIKIAPVLKSNAYGHGIRLTGRILDEVGAPFLCVDSLYEAFQLQKNQRLYAPWRNKTPILIMGYIHPESLKLKKLPFSFAVYDFEHAQILNEYQKGSKLHIFIDTGMNREGVSMEKLPEFFKELKKLKNIEIEGLMSHLAQPDKPNSALTKLQLKNFKKARQMYEQFSLTTRAAGLAFGDARPGWKANIWFHLGGSYGLLNGLTADCNMVRIGRAVYGISDQGEDLQESFLKPVLRHTSSIVQIKNIKKSEKVGYSGTFTANKDTTIGILPLGYNDGVDRRLSNKGVVTVDGILCPIIGLVSMNITTIDLSNVRQPFLGQVAVVFSDNPDDPNSLINASKKGKILPHEMLIHIAESTKRVAV